MERTRYQNGLARDHSSRFGFKIIKFCQGTTQDRPFYAFVSIEPHNLGYFENHYKADHYTDFSLFGREILRGWGDTPPDEIIDFIRFKHNIEFGVDPAYILHMACLTLQAGQLQERAKKPSHSPFPRVESNSPEINSMLLKEYPEKPADALVS